MILNLLGRFWNHRLPGKTLGIAIVYLFFAAPTALAEDAIRVLAVSIGGNPVHQRVLETLSGELRQKNNGIELHTIEIDPAKPEGIKDRIPPETRLVIPIGSQSFKQVASEDIQVPVFATLIPKLSFEQIMQTSGIRNASVNALYLDQPFERQLKLVRIFFRKPPRILAILGPTSGRHREDIEAAAKALNLRMQITELKDDRELDRSFNDLLSESDTLLAIADPAIYNQHNVQFIFLSTYRKMIPVFGFSEGYVKAGALAAVYATPEQLGRQTAEMLRAWKPNHATKKSPDSAYPDDFTVSTNPRVARSLGITLPEESAITDTLKKTSR